MLSRFAQYLERTWDFTDYCNQIQDHRIWNSVSTSSVYLSCFGMFALRLPSFNALEEELILPHRWDPWVGKKKPSADTLGYALERIDLGSLRKVLVQINHQIKRKKILKSHSPPYLVAAVDGVELFRSYKRCCKDCLQRVLESPKGPVVEYYHRAVVLQIVNAWPCLILDVEPILPKEGEVSAAQRLLERAKKLYPRFFDILTFDALYLGAPFLKKVIDLGWDAVIVLKQENRDLYQDAEQLMKITKPQVENNLQKQKIHWDLENLTTWPQLGRPIRVVCSHETRTQRERIANRWVERTVTQDWKWATTLPKKIFDASYVNRIGHARWDEETRGFMELTQYWSLDHCFHHHPNAITACLLILSQAFILTTLFYHRNLKPQLREKISRLTLARLFADDLAKLWTTSFWSHPP